MEDLLPLPPPKLLQTNLSDTIFCGLQFII